MLMSNSVRKAKKQAISSHFTNPHQTPIPPLPIALEMNTQMVTAEAENHFSS